MWKGVAIAGIWASIAFMGWKMTAPFPTVSFALLMGVIVTVVIAIGDRW